MRLGCRRFMNIMTLSNNPVYIENKRTKQLFMCVEVLNGEKEYYVLLTDLAKMLKTKKEIEE